MAQLPAQRTCGTADVHDLAIRTDPEYARARASIDAQTEAFIRSGRFAERIRQVGTTVIPVVVHVIYRNELERISDAQIASQIDVLNHDFRMNNEDVSKTPAPFKALVSDARIAFVLTGVDPQGKPARGITHTQTTVPRFFADDKMKSKATGGADAWDSTRYLNIWVCPEIIWKKPDGTEDPLLGYATFPGRAAAIDGVAIVQNAFGTIGTAGSGKYNLGRTTTHEVGHWLNLIHIWGDEDDCTGDDQVADTPVQKTQNYGTPTFPQVTCNNGPHGDMFMNYMDYVDDKAMFMFTAGQVARMQATLDGPRSAIGSLAVAAAP
jgi:Pregnancy-associated plasma protein-A